jgi:uncharacterized protein YcfJ
MVGGAATGASIGAMAGGGDGAAIGAGAGALAGALIGAIIANAEQENGSNKKKPLAAQPFPPSSEKLSNINAN